MAVSGLCYSTEMDIHSSRLGSNYRNAWR